MTCVATGSATLKCAPSRRCRCPLTLNFSANSFQHMPQTLVTLPTNELRHHSYNPPMPQKHTPPPRHQFLKITLANGNKGHTPRQLRPQPTISQPFHPLSSQPSTSSPLLTALSPPPPHTITSHIKLQSTAATNIGRQRTNPKIKQMTRGADSHAISPDRTHWDSEVGGMQEGRDSEGTLAKTCNTGFSRQAIVTWVLTQVAPMRSRDGNIYAVWSTPFRSLSELKRIHTCMHDKPGEPPRRKGSLHLFHRRVRVHFLRLHLRQLVFNLHTSVRLELFDSLKLIVEESPFPLRGLRLELTVMLMCGADTRCTIGKRHGK